MSTQEQAKLEQSSETLTTRPGQASKKMSRAEAGRKGGMKTKERHGGDFFGRIGKMGGKKGGESTKKRYGVEFYREIGRKGGSK